MSNIVKKWVNTVAVIDLNSPIQKFFESNQIGTSKPDGYYIYNKENTWFFEEEFINTPNHNLQQIFDKLSIKNYDSIQFFDCVTKKINEVTEHDAEDYLKIINLNVISGIEYDKLKISLNLLSGGNYNTKSDRVRHLINIYILILLSNRTKRQQNRLEFTFESDLDSFIFETEFGKGNFTDGLLEVYEWIVNNKEYSEAYLETLIVLDGTTGQNAMAQAKQFKEATDISGIILTKLDGTAKGGIAIAIQSELGIPVKYIGIGEQVDDLQRFDPDMFVNALFEKGEEN